MTIKYVALNGTSGGEVFRVLDGFRHSSCTWVQRLLQRLVQIFPTVDTSRQQWAAIMWIWPTEGTSMPPVAGRVFKVTKGKIVTGKLPEN